jgi:hypothetical protein
MSRKEEFTEFEKQVLKDEQPKAKQVFPGDEMVSFQFINRDDALTDPKTKKKFDLEFNFQGVKYKFVDGKTHTAPRAVMDHLNGVNGGCSYPIYSTVKDEDGNQVVVQTGSIPRFLCVEVAAQKAA